MKIPNIPILGLLDLIASGVPAMAEQRGGPNNDPVGGEERSQNTSL